MNSIHIIPAFRSDLVTTYAIREQDGHGDILVTITFCANETFKES